MKKHSCFDCILLKTMIGRISKPGAPFLERAASGYPIVTGYKCWAKPHMEMRYWFPYKETFCNRFESKHEYIERFFEDGWED